MNLNNNGIIILKDIIKDHKYLENINEKLYIWLDEKNKKYNRDDNCLHHILVYDKIILDELLKILSVNTEIINYFKIGFIMHSCGAVINKPSKTSYTHNWHIDTFEKTNENIMLNVLIPLCNFTLENGCTKIFPKNNTEQYEDILLNKSDILLFNSSLKHCTGENKSNHDRNCLTITLIKPYLKPQFNYLSIFTLNELEEMNDDLKKLYNYYSQIPDNLYNFYNRKCKLII